MKRAKGFTAFRVLGFLVVLVLTLMGLTRLFVRKESMERFKPYLETAQEYDVIFMGNSHVVNDIFPFDLWRNYGITAYNLGGNGNTVPVSYWSMKLAFDYAKPKLLIMDVNDIDMKDKVSGHTSNVHTTFDVYPISRTKINAVLDLMDLPYVEDFDGNVIKDMRWEYLFTLGKYHSRWSELTMTDISPTYSQTKGAHVAINVVPSIEYEITDDMVEESGYGFTYLRNIIQDCQAEGIDILLVNLPYPAHDFQQVAANTVQSIADEYGINYINFVSLDQVVDYQVDLFDGDSHLNPSGARKVTDYIGDYIRRHYDLPDHRNDEQYAKWHAEYDAYLELKNGYLAMQSDVNSALMLLHDEDYSVACLISPDTSLYGKETALTLLQNIGREHVFESDAYTKWADGIFPLEELDWAAEDHVPYLFVLDRQNHAKLECRGESDFEYDFSFGHLRYSATDEAGSLSITAGDGTELTAEAGTDSPGIQFFTFNTETGDLICESAF
ncbi:MAG: hypothetical protein IJT77_09980 [Clostridia bacterium]|nr:hypothetical protein [Clostridia bacterium]